MVATIALPLALFAYAAWLSWTSTIVAADREISRTLDVAFEHALKVFETIDLSLAETEEAVRGMSDGSIRAEQPRIHRRLSRLADALPQIKSLWLFDAQGRSLVNSIDSGPTAGDFFNREYFKVHVDRADLNPFVGPVLIPRAPFGGAPFFSVSRRRTADLFNGVVQASVLPEYFELFYERIAQDSGMFFALGLADGNIIARFPAAKEPVRIDRSQAAAVQMAKNPLNGILTVSTPSDGIERRIAYKRMVPYPIYVAAGFSTSAIHGRWKSTVLNYVVIGLPLTAIVFGLLAMALRRTKQLYREATLRRKAEDALHRGQKLEALGHLTGGVAHDFNNLLSVIASSTDLLRKEHLPYERRLRYVDAISDTVKRASVLTGRLLTFARSRHRTAIEFDVSECLHSISEIIRTLCGPRINVSLETTAIQFLVHADKSQFETAIINLAANARDAMSGIGSLTINVSAAESGSSAFPKADSNEAYVCVSVRDTGSGISGHDLEHIFEPFFTTKDEGKGTGLGLSQVFGFALESGGHVRAESVIGSGSTFHLYLPLLKTSSAAAS